MRSVTNRLPSRPHTLTIEKNKKNVYTDPHVLLCWGVHFGDTVIKVQPLTKRESIESSTSWTPPKYPWRTGHSGPLQYRCRRKSRHRWTAVPRSRSPSTRPAGPADEYTGRAAQVVTQYLSTLERRSIIGGTRQAFNHRLKAFLFDLSALFYDGTLILLWCFQKTQLSPAALSSLKTARSCSTEKWRNMGKVPILCFQVER